MAPYEKDIFTFFTFVAHATRTKKCGDLSGLRTDQGLNLVPAPPKVNFVISNKMMIIQYQEAISNQTFKIRFKNEFSRYTW